MQKKIYWVYLSVIVLFFVMLAALAPLCASASSSQDDVNLSLTAERRVTAGSGRDINGTFYISTDSTFSQSYTVTNQSASDAPINIVLQERVLSESGVVISDWINLTATLNKGSSTTLSGTNLVMNSTYGKKITVEYKLQYKNFWSWTEYTSRTSDILVYAPTFSATYTTDASPVALSDFPIYFGGKITLLSGEKVKDVVLYDSVHGLIASVGELTQNITTRFQKDFFLPAGDVESHLIVEYTDMLTGKKTQTALTDVKIAGKIVDAPMESKLSLSALPAKTFIPSAQTVEVIFALQNDLPYDILSSYVYLLDQNGKASAEPIFDFGPLTKGQDLTVKKNVDLQPDIKYSYAVYAYVPDTSTPFKAGDAFVTTSTPPSLAITRSIEGEKLPFYQEAAVRYVAKNISPKDVTDIVIADGILGEIYKGDLIKAGGEVTFTVKHKFTADFVSNPIVNLVIKDGAQTKSTFMIERQTFEVTKKDRPSIALFIENIKAKDRKNVSFDAVLANDGNTGFTQIDVMDARDDVVIKTLSYLGTGEKQIVQITGQNYEKDKKIHFKIKAITPQGEEMTFDTQPTALPTSFRAMLLILFISFAALGTAAVVYYKKHRNKMR